MQDPSRPGEFIRSQRRCWGLSQQQVAKVAELGLSRFCEIESNFGDEVTEDEFDAVYLAIATYRATIERVERPTPAKLPPQPATVAGGRVVPVRRRA